MLDLSRTDLGAVILGLMAASLPGILVALFTYYLSLRHERQVVRQLIASARALLALEMEGNREALATFWRGLNVLDAEGHAPDETEAHLAAMASAGLLMRTLPHWSFVRWERIPAQALATLDAKGIAEIDRIYRDLREVTDLYTQLITLIPEEREQLDRDRFWQNRYAGWRVGTFTRLRAVVERILAAHSPLSADRR